MTRLQRHDDRLATRVCAALDALVDIGRSYHGLFPSLMDRRRNRMLTHLPPAIQGQRDGDRSHLGSNLIHDQAILKTLYALATHMDRPAYAAAADEYLQYFATHCTDTATGLFPWGEHSYWHLMENRVGNSYVDAAHLPGDRPATHDHLRQAPRWLWEKLWQFNPRCVERFAQGLDFHWQQGRRVEYIRHGRIEQRQYPTPGRYSCDFPRHGGFYIYDWAFAWEKTGRPQFHRQMRDMLDYWWPKRDQQGLLRTATRADPDSVPRQSRVNAPGQTISLAASLLETAQYLQDSDPALAATMRQRAAVYINGFLAAPHDPANGIFLIGCHLDEPTLYPMPIWGSEYGVWPACYVALTCLCAYRLTDDARLLAWAEAAGKCYAQQPFPDGQAVPAMDAGLALGLLADLYDITGETSWHDAMLTLADTLTDVYLDDDHPLPRGAAGIDWYESQMGPSFLLHALARTALLSIDREHCPLDADYTAR